jgi:hypothetical protein
MWSNIFKNITPDQARQLYDKLAFDNERNAFLNKEGTSVKRDGKTCRKYNELIKGCVKVRKIETINQLILDGEEYEERAVHRTIPPS